MSFDGGARSSSSLRGQSPLPGGTITFAFTDIEASTDLLRRLGDGYAEVLSEHRRIIRTTFGEVGGIEIDRQGDAFFFAFRRARDAVAVAVDVQRRHVATAWPEGIQVRVRIGLHTGEPVVGDEGYLGIDVVRAARICTVAQGGHVLLSETTRALIGSTVPEGATILPMGERLLKGIDAPEQIYELAIEGLADDRAGEEPLAALGVPARVDRVIEERFGSFGTEVVGGVSKRIARFCRPDDANLDDLATRAVTSLDRKLRGGVSAALRAAGASFS